MGTIIFWLGMTDTAAEGQWVWNSDGSPVTWTIWGRGEPDGGSSQNCVDMLRNYAINIGEGDKKKWGTGGCESPHARTVVCEKKEKIRKYIVAHLLLITYN